LLGSSAASPPFRYAFTHSTTVVGLNPNARLIAACDAPSSTISFATWRRNSTA
jgi:hypothetical protein